MAEQVGNAVDKANKRLYGKRAALQQVLIKSG
jgi:hypothetical protein